MIRDETAVVAADFTDCADCQRRILKAKPSIWYLLIRGKAVSVLWGR
jgi:hypothetical protein